MFVLRPWVATDKQVAFRGCFCVCGAGRVTVHKSELLVRWWFSWELSLLRPYFVPILDHHVFSEQVLGVSAGILSDFSVWVSVSLGLRSFFCYDFIDLVLWLSFFYPENSWVWFLGHTLEFLNIAVMLGLVSLKKKKTFLFECSVSLTLSFSF